MINSQLLIYLLFLEPDKLLKKQIMKLRARYSLSIIVFFIATMVASCSSPAYRQNKYKSGKRFRDCGCMAVPTHDKSILSLNEQK